MNTTLLTILETQTESYNTKAMADTMAALLLSSGATIETDKAGNLFATKGAPPAGQFYPCIAAHLDSVHDIFPEGRYHILELGGKAFAMDSQTLRFAGVGGDDKCGLYIALQVLRSVPFCKVALFVDEEVGCDGSGVASLDWFADCGYILQNDRRGYADSVRTIMGSRIASDSFINAVEPINRKYQRSWCDSGGLTDVYTLATRGLELSMLNLSCGYYLPHQPEEYIDIAELEAVLRFNIEVVRKLGGTRYENKAERTSYGYGGYYSHHWSEPAIKSAIDPEPDAEPSCDYCKAENNLELDSWGWWCHNCGGYSYRPDRYTEEDTASIDWPEWDE